MSEMCCKRCGSNEDRINGFCSVECEEYYSLEEEINALDNVILERGAEIGRLTARIAELEGLVDELIEAGDWGAKLAINIGALSGDNQYKLAKTRYDKWDALVKDWKEREE